ncbi:hypothetical protein ACFQO4_20655 [Saliphagus sp. GCM10025334]
MLSILMLVVVVFAIAYVLTTRFPNTARRWFRRFWALRAVFFALFWLSFAWVLIGSGVLPLMLVGMAVFFIAAMYIFVENPQQEVRSWIR